MVGDVWAWAATHVGSVRHHNEDACQVGSWRSGRTGDSWSGPVTRAPLWAAVADGMGGHSHGATASSIVIDCIAELVTTQMGQAEIIEMVAEANVRVFEAMSRPGGRPAMGSTVVGFVATGHDGWIFNVGDSRAYLLANGRLHLASQDHTPQRSAGVRSHALTQSLGGTLTPRPLLPHVVPFNTSEVDAILLCSDGLTDMLGDEEILALLNQTTHERALELVDAALEAGGLDNVTAIVLNFRD